MFVKSETPSNANTSWIQNFGGSFHVTSEPLNIKQLQQFERPNHVFIGNGASLSISRVHSSSFLSPYDSRVLFQLKHLLHVPSITKNLLSVSQFAKDNSIF